MKKQLAGVLTAAAVFSFSATSAFGAGRGCHFQDNNQDGVCDFAYTACVFGDEDQDGACDFCGMGCDDENWHGIHYTDANPNGICDYYEDGTCPHGGLGDGRGYGGHKSHGRHCR